MTRAVCQRCGGVKASYPAPCPACGHRPEGEGLLVAWLLSDEHLSGDALDGAGSRIRAGQPVRPSDRQLDRARRMLGQHLNTDAGLGAGRRRWLLAVSLLITPAVALTIAVWWWTERPRAAREAAAIGVPASILATLLLGWASFPWRFLVG